MRYIGRTPAASLQPASPRIRVGRRPGVASAATCGIARAMWHQFRQGSYFRRTSSLP